MTHIGWMRTLPPELLGKLLLCPIERLRHDDRISCTRGTPEHTSCDECIAKFLQTEVPEMTDQERLVDLIVAAKKEDPETGSFTDFLAQYLLNHGVRFAGDPDETQQPGPAQENAPLTYEQLFARHGKPVWIQQFRDGHILSQHWALVYNDYTGLTDLLKIVSDHRGRYTPRGKYGEDWVAYLRPPEGEIT